MQVSTQQVEWIGRYIDDFLIEELIGEGLFSWVYRGISEERQLVRAFKIAKPAEMAGSLTRTDIPLTQALAVITGGVTSVKPDPAELLAFQTRKLMISADPALVAIESFDEGAECYARMHYLQGPTLRQAIAAGRVELSLLVDLARALDRLTKNQEFRWHGDIKPDNIMLTSSGAKLIDPGYFGPIAATNGHLEGCIVTTPMYYPFLKPDDLFAFGSILWEIACRRHPLVGATSSHIIDKTRLSPDLVDWVRSREMVGQYYLTPILEAGLPTEHRPELSPVTEAFLLKAIRLRVSPDGRIDRDPGFADFKDLADSLQYLIDEGVDRSW